MASLPHSSVAKAQLVNDLAKVWDIPAAQCPVGGLGRRYKAFDHEEMHASLAVAPRDEPVFYSPELDDWVVTGYDDVFAILRDPERFSAANANTPITPVPREALDLLQEGGNALGGVRVNCDPPRHTCIRDSAARFLNVKRFAGFEGSILEVVGEAYVDPAGKSRVDLLKEFTHELPARVIFMLLGIPDEDAAQVKSWSTSLLLSFSRPTHEQQVEAAKTLLKFWTYCVGLVEQRIRDPRDDYPSAVLNIRNGDDSALAVNEINSAVFCLLFAGYETTTSQATSAILALLSDRESWEAIRADSSLIANGVEESLRIHGAVVNWRRRAKCEVEIVGVAIPAGSSFLISPTSANRDSKYFADRDRFDVHRANARKHLTFGNGIHFCLGAPLARLKMKIMIEELSRRCPRARLVPDRTPGYAPAFAFRAPQSLWVDLDP